MSFPPAMKKPGARLGNAMPSPEKAAAAAAAGKVPPMEGLAGRPPKAAGKKMPPVKSVQDLKNIFKSKFGSK